VQLRPPIVPGPEQALPEPEIYARLAEAMELVPPLPAELSGLAERALEPEGAAAFLAAARAASGGSTPAMLFWAYRSLGPRLPAPSLVAIWVQCHENAFLRRESVLRTLGADWQDASPFAIAAELFRRILEHPEGVEVARSSERMLDSAIGWEDGRIRLAPAEILGEIRRAIEHGPPSDPEYPFVLGGGLRTRWTANTIQRDPAWRKGRGPHCALNLSRGDAGRLGVANGDRVRVVTRRGSLELPAAVDARLQDGHCWIPNGFGMAYPKNGDGPLEIEGVNVNELTAASDRDPISGCPEHKATACRVERV